MLMVADVKKDRQREMTETEAALFGIDKLNVPRQITNQAAATIGVGLAKMRAALDPDAHTE